ncbi:MAG TPA: CHAT domain-containing protein, partial [Pyrinomonadaceae bacterium]
YGSSRSQLYLGSDANEERLRSQESQVDILHFVAPMLLDETSPMSSFVTLAPSAAADGFLQTREVVNLSTSAQLVMMSNVIRHGETRGAANAALAWSWFVAGSPATMWNRWSIEPNASSKLLTQFYSTIKPSTGMSFSKPVALRRSILALRAAHEYQHPHYWASFALIGHDR